MFNNTKLWRRLVVITSLLMPVPAMSQTDFLKSGVVVLPSADTSKAIEQLPSNGFDDWKKQAATPRELKVDFKNLDVFGKEKVEMNESGSKSVPFVVPNSMMILFTPDHTGSG